MKKSVLWLFLLLVGTLIFAGCGSTTTGNGGSNTPASTASPVTLTIFAASSLKNPFDALAKSYHNLHSNVTITPVYDSSATLEQQLANGASADIFASADTTNMQKASQAGLVGNSQIFAKNHLVVILPASNPAHITSLKDLARSGTKIDLANSTVPVGKYSRQVLDNMGKSADYGHDYETAVLNNVVSQEQNDAAIVQKVQLGEVDAGFVYVSDINPATAKNFVSLTIPDKLNVLAQYPLAVLKNSQHNSEAQAFEQYILSADGQGVLKQYNFLPANG